MHTPTRNVRVQLCENPRPRAACITILVISEKRAPLGGVTDTRDRATGYCSVALVLDVKRRVFLDYSKLLRISFARTYARNCCELATRDRDRDRHRSKRLHRGDCFFVSTFVPESLGFRLKIDVYALSSESYRVARSKNAHRVTIARDGLAFLYSLVSTRSLPFLDR